MAKAGPTYALLDAFNSGEFSPRLYGQVRLNKYPSACAVLENMIVYPHGPFHSRQGLEWVAVAKDSSKAVVVRPFTSGNIKSYMLEWGEQYIRFYSTLLQQIKSGGVPVEVSTSYDETDLPYLRFAQSMDVQYIVRRTQPVNKLLHYSDTSWTFEEADITDGPYRDENIDGVTFLQVNSTSGNGVTITASTHSIPLTVGTGKDTASTDQAAFYDATHDFVGFRLQHATPFQINSASLYFASGPIDADITISAKIYADSAGSPSGAALDSVGAQTVAIGASGILTWAFTTPASLSATTDYWIVFQAVSQDAAVTLSTVVQDTAYGSGLGENLAGISDSLSYSWKCDVNITPLGSTNPVVFNSGHVGSLWRLRHAGGKSTRNFSAVGQTSTPIQLRGKFTVDSTPNATSYFSGEVVLQNSTDTQNWTDVASFFYSTTQEFVESRDNVWYRLYCKQRTYGSTVVTITQAECWGTIKLTSVTNGYTAVGDVLFPFASISPTTFWREGAWSTYRGYPEAVCFHDNRLWFGRDIFLWASWVGDFENFNPDGDTDSSALTFSPSQLESSIVWIESTSKGIMIGALGEEGRIWGGTTDKPITPTSVQCQVQDTVGCAQYPEAVKIGPAVLFVQLDRRRVREFVYDLTTDSFKAPDLTIRAEHITPGGIFDMAYQQFPNSILFATRADGVLLGMTYYRDEDVVGWHRHITGSTTLSSSTHDNFESVGVIASSVGVEEGYDQLWTVVKRTINGVDYRFIEVMANHESTSSAPRAVTEFNCLDCSTVYTSPGSATLTGLDRFDGSSVYAVADGIVSGPHTVAGGQITLDATPTKAYVGLPYLSTYASLPIEIPSKDGTTAGRDKQAYKMIMRLIDTIGGRYGPDLDHLQTIVGRTAKDVIGQQIPLFSGLKQLSFNSNQLDMQVWVESTPGLPITVSMISLNMETNEA